MLMMMMMMMSVLMHQYALRAKPSTAPRGSVGTRELPGWDRSIMKLPIRLESGGSVVVLEEIPCPRGSPRTNLQVFVLVLGLQTSRIFFTDCMRFRISLCVKTSSAKLYSNHSPI